jgi:peptidoglycan/LPS O-acetylase OafA/YrhL
MDLSHKNNFHLIRLLAACQVVAIHSIDWLHLPIYHSLYYVINLFPGVAVFFIISGYLVTKSYIEGGDNLKFYFLSRALRIYPGLWINLILILILLYFSGEFNRPDWFSYHFFSPIIVLFMYGNVCPAIICQNNSFLYTGFYKVFPSGVLWTISIELGFYFFVPFIFSFFKRKKFKIFSFIFCSSFIISLILAVYNTHYILEKNKGHLANVFDITIFVYLWIFLIGACIYLSWNRLSKIIINKWTIWLTIYISLSLLALIINHDRLLNFKIIGFFNFSRILILAFLTLSFAHSAKSLNIFPGKIDLSYGIYLFHMQIIYTLLYSGYTRSRILWIIVFILTFITAACCWFLIEKPCLKFKNRFKIQSQPTITSLYLYE